MPTPSFAEPGGARLCRLPDGVRVEDVARRARHAGLSFLAGAGDGWGKTKLRSWLILEYGMATEWTRVPEVRPWLDAAARTSDAEVRRFTIDTRQRMVRMLLDAFETWKAPSFAAALAERGLIMRVRDELGHDGWAPVADTDMELGDRVLSLFAVHYLAHPREYERVRACEGCGDVCLGETARHVRCAPSVREGVATRARESGTDLHHAAEAARAKVRAAG